MQDINNAHKKIQKVKNDLKTETCNWRGGLKSIPLR